MSTVEVIVTCAKVLVVFTALMMSVPVWVILERRGVAFIQDRVGPDRCGPWGLIQPFADAVKLLFKEDITPRHVDKLLYFAAPAFCIIVPTTAFAVVPFGSSIRIGGFSLGFQVADFGVGVLFILAVLSMSSFGLVCAGWAQNNKYGILSALRGVAQSISYEIAMCLAVVAVVMSTGVEGSSSLTMSSIVADQGGAYLGFFPKWNVFVQPLAFFIFIAAMYAETNRTPFDFVECEQELVAGYMTEYSSMKFSMLFMGEYVSMTVQSALLVTFFLGGWTLPWIDLGGGGVAAGVASVLVFLVKWFAVAWLYIWVRWTVPRLRFDKLMDLGWKALVPLALMNIVITALVGVWIGS